MKKLIALFIAITFIINGFAQMSFCDDFDSYQSGDPIAQTSPNWNTWGELMNGTTSPFSDDAVVVTTMSYSGDNSLYLLDATGSGGPQDIVLLFDTTQNIVSTTPLSTPYTTGHFNFSQMMYIVSGRTGYINFQAENMPGVQWALEVNIDANGILNVTAKDLGTGKDAKITIESSSKMSDADVEKMKEDAEKFAEEDKKKKESVDIKNEAESYIYSTEKLVNQDLKDKIPQEQGIKVTDAIKELKESLTQDSEQIKVKLDAVKSLVNEITTELYKNSAPPSGEEQQSNENQKNNEQQPNQENNDKEQTESNNSEQKSENP